MEKEAPEERRGEGGTRGEEREAPEAMGGRGRHQTRLLSL